MLLKEVLSKEVPYIKKTTKQAKDILNTPNHELLGAGAQAIAYLHKKFPDKVIKTIQITGPEDPSYQFLRLCIKHKNNPYFPKIYNVKMYNSDTLGYWTRRDDFEDMDPWAMYKVPRQQYYTMFVVTEKLTPLERVLSTDLERFGIDKIDFGDITLWQHVKVPTAIYGSKFRVAFEHPQFRKQIYDHTTDPMLKQALRLLEPLFRNYTPDMHLGNVMTRPNGEWVFADPVYRKGG